MGYSADLIRTALAALDAEFVRRGLTHEFVVIGSSSLLLQGISIRPTNDVDVLGRVGGGGTVESMSPLPSQVLDAAQAVASALAMEGDWFGDDRTIGIVEAGLPEGFVARLTRLQIGPALSLLLPARRDLIAFKIDAGANSGDVLGNSKHHEDLEALAPTDEELDLAITWMSDKYVEDDAAISDARSLAAWLRERRS